MQLEFIKSRYVLIIIRLEADAFTLHIYEELPQNDVLLKKSFFNNLLQRAVVVLKLKSALLWVSALTNSHK